MSPRPASLLGLEATLARVRAELDGALRERDDVRRMFEREVELHRGTRDDCDVLRAGLEMAMVAVVSRDLVDRAFECLTDERRGAPGRARALLAEALGR